MTFRPWQNFPPLQLKNLLASNASADEEDVLNVKQRLNASGHYEVPSYGMTRYPDNRLFDGIKSFQRDQGLTVDGEMQPGGETEDALNKAMADRTPPDPLSERQEAVIAFAKKYGMAEDQAREYMTKPSIFKTSGQRSVTAAPQVAENLSQPITQTTPQSSPSTSQTITTAPKPVTLTPQQQADADYRIKVQERVAQQKHVDAAGRFSAGVPDDIAASFAPELKPPGDANDRMALAAYAKMLGLERTTSNVARAFTKTLAFEGYMKKASSGSAAGGGFTAGTLTNLQNFMKKTDQELGFDPVQIAARDRLLTSEIDKVKAPENLTVEQSVTLSKSLHDTNLSRVGGHEAVEMIENDLAAAALLDTLHRHKGSDGIRAIQRAINQVRPRSVAEDGIMGSETFQLYQQLADDPDAWHMLGPLLADQRKITAREENKKKGRGLILDSGDEKRFDYFAQPASRSR